MTRLRWAIALMVVGGALFAGTPSVGAATVEATGWWWRPQTSALPSKLPPPPGVAAGQLLVQGQPEGATAVAAIRFKLGETEGSPVLTLEPAQGSQVPADAVVLACRAAVTWAPEEVGAWENKPLADCAASVQGIPGEGGALTFALGPLQSADVLDVVLVPGTVAAAPAGANGSTFSLVLDKPGPDALVTSQSSASTGGSFASDSGASGSGATDVGLSSGTAGAFAGPTDFTPAPAAAAANPSLTPQEQQPAVATQPSPAPFDDGYDTGTRVVGLLIFAAGAAFALRGGLSGRASSTEAAPVAGGLGRFTRERTGTPPPLT